MVTVLSHLQLQILRLSYFDGTVMTMVIKECSILGNLQVRGENWFVVIHILTAPTVASGSGFGLLSYTTACTHTHNTELGLVSPTRLSPLRFCPF